VIYLISSVVTGECYYLAFTSSIHSNLESSVVRVADSRCYERPIPQTGRSTEAARRGARAPGCWVGTAGGRGSERTRTGVREGLLILEVSQTELVKSHSRNW
jgi:hypothetical protein